MRSHLLHPLVALAALGVLSGCSTVESFIPHSSPVGSSLSTEPREKSAQMPTNPVEKPIALPVASIDINCPEVDIAEGGAALRVGGADSASVRYQFNISDAARQCDPAGPGQATIKIGVAGNLIIGPAGSPGTFSAPLRIVVTQDADKKEIFSKTYRIEATADAVSSGQFRMVAEPIALPMPTLQLASLYTVTVGFEGAGSGAPRAHRRKVRG